MDITPITDARRHAETVEERARADIARAHAAYGAVVRTLVDEHGATAVAKALEVTRARVYQLMDKADADG